MTNLLDLMADFDWIYTFKLAKARIAEDNAQADLFDN